MKVCDIVIPVWDELDSTKKCIELIKENTYCPYRLIIVDNASNEPTRRYLESLKKDFQDYILLRNNVNLGFVKAVNQGIITSTSPYICLLNNDAYVTKGWLKNIVDSMENQEKLGIVNPTSNIFGKAGPDGKPGEWQELDYCRGFCMVVKREVVDRIGLFDEAYGMGYFEEKDFSMRAIQAGYICVRVKSSYVYHKDRLSFDRIKERDEIFKRNEIIFNKKWGRPLSIGFVVKKADDLNDKKFYLYKLLKNGHRINIFYIEKPYYLKDHIQIRYIYIGKIFPLVKLLFKLWERRRKKKVEIVVVNENGVFALLNRFRLIHNAEVVKFDFPLLERLHKEKGNS